MRTYCNLDTQIHATDWIDCLHSTHLFQTYLMCFKHLFIHLQYLCIHPSIHPSINPSLQLQAQPWCMAITHSDSEEVTANTPSSEYTSKTTYTEIALTLLDLRHERWTRFALLTASVKPPCFRGVALVKLFVLPLIVSFIKTLLGWISECSLVNEMWARLRRRRSILIFFRWNLISV